MSRKVTPDLAAEFRRLVRENGYLHKDVAYEYGVSAHTVYTYTRDIPKRRSVRGAYSARSRHLAVPRDPEREARMVAAARDGDTLDMIAAREGGITRERVRQILAAYSRRTGEALFTARPRGPAKVVQPPPTLAQRLLGLASLSDGGCWKWEGSCHALSKNGPPRPIFRPCGNKNGPELATRWAYVLWRDPDIGSKQIHPVVCGDRNCINPYHWERRVPDGEESQTRRRSR